MKKFLCLLFLSLSVATGMRAQGRFAVKTNLLYDATATVNAGVEVGLAPRWSFDLSGNYNAWSFNERKWKHWMLQPEARYWFCDYFTGHFVAVHGIGGKYNFGNIPNNIKFLGTDLSMLTDHRYEGYAVGAGIAYGYAWILSRHWNIEAEAGFGYMYTWFDKFKCDACSTRVGNGDHHYIGPTKLAVNVVYVF